MTELTDLLARTPEARAVVRGQVSNTVLVPGDDLFVTVPSFDGNRVQWGPCPWSPSDALPTRGDECLVLFDEHEQPWVMALAPVGSSGDPGPQGPPGPAGPTGPAGPQGPKGDPGATGATGAQGPKGDTGAQGPQGATGATGAQGPKGDPGATGAQGPQGPTGATGSQGPTGATGSQGPQGATGAAGLVWKGVWAAATAYAVNDAVTYAGSSWRRKVAGTSAGAPDTDAANWELLAQKGDVGATGAQGAQGPQGATGPQGPQGPQGIQGPSGASTFVAGSGAPTAAVGVDGAIYLDTASGRMWGPKAAGAWPATAFGRVMPLSPTYAQVTAG